MAEATTQTPENEEKGAVPAPTIFRLPRFFTQGAESAAEEAIAEMEVAANPTGDPAMEPSAGARNEHMVVAPTPGVVVNELSSLRKDIERLTEQVQLVNERESSLERVFDTLHSELSDYKNDFLYEHLKPVVRPLLFLFDSIEQFDGEVSMAQSQNPGEGGNGVLSAAVVLENVHYFRDQLVESLRVCEVTIMEAPSGAFNNKFHKAVDVVPVPAEQDNTIVRVVRSGWFLNGQLLRPAEVVVGKFRAPTRKTDVQAGGAQAEKA